MKKVIKIDGMSCGHCVNHVKNALEDIPGVSQVEVSLVNKMAVCEVEANVLDETIKAEIEDAGYKVLSIA